MKKIFCSIALTCFLILGVKSTYAQTASDSGSRMAQTTTTRENEDHSNWGLLGLLGLIGLAGLRKRNAVERVDYKAPQNR